jgi:hypothetical protein
MEVKLILTDLVFEAMMTQDSHRREPTQGLNAPPPGRKEPHPSLQRKTRIQSPGGRYWAPLQNFYRGLAWAGGVVQVVECLPGNHKALSSNPIPPKRKKIQRSGLPVVR